jgi:hypothetical protein
MADKKNKTQVELQRVKIAGVVTTHEESSDNASFRHTSVSTVPMAICGENKKRNAITIRNLSGDTVWIGDRHVLAGINGNGFPLFQNDVINLDKNTGEIFGVTAANTSTLAIIEE